MIAPAITYHGSSPKRGHWPVATRCEAAPGSLIAGRYPEGEAYPPGPARPQQMSPNNRAVPPARSESGEGRASEGDPREEVGVLDPEVVQLADQVGPCSVLVGAYRHGPSTAR